MNILAVCGSPHVSGVSARMLHSALEAFRPDKDMIEAVACYDTQISPCSDCGFCKIAPYRCAICDGMEKIYDLIDWSNVIILAFPLYYNSFPAPLKLMVDRTMCLYRRRFLGDVRPEHMKTGIALVSAGAGKSRGEECISSQIKMFFDVCCARVEYTAFFDENDAGFKHDFDTVKKGVRQCVFGIYD